eukprot:1161832-Pelagomonas_calceolata.AAC.6
MVLTQVMCLHAEAVLTHIICLHAEVVFTHITCLRAEAVPTHTMCLCAEAVLLPLTPILNPYPHETKVCSPWAHPLARLCCLREPLQLPGELRVLAGRMTRASIAWAFAAADALDFVHGEFQWTWRRWSN